MELHSTWLKSSDVPIEKRIVHKERKVEHPQEARKNLIKNRIKKTKLLDEINLKNECLDALEEV